MCIEFLIFYRAQGYVQYLNDDVSTKWTPKQVLSELLNADPLADETVSLSVGAQPDLARPPEAMQGMGEDRRFKLKWADTNWNALSSFLHAPTLQQLKDRPPSHDKIVARAHRIAEHLTHVLAAPVHRFVGGQVHILPACSECGKQTVRLAAGVTKAGGFICRTPTCKAIYDLEEDDQHRVGFLLRTMDVECPNCKEIASHKAHHVVPGGKLSCGCGVTMNVIMQLSVEIEEIQRPLET
jgi:hypothetical protein